VGRLIVLALLLVAASALAPISSAGTVDPARLVLRQSDVPAAYRLNPDKSGVRTTKIDSADYPELRAKYPAWGRVSGYQVTFEKANDSIVSRADVFRGRTGATKMYAWFVGEVRKQTQVHLRGTTLTLGREGIAYSWKAGNARFTIAVWRYGRTFSVVGGGGLERARVLALAGVQQHRVAAAFR
jgi:hypothetical protein